MQELAGAGGASSTSNFSGRSWLCPLLTLPGKAFRRSFQGSLLGRGQPRPPPHRVRRRLRAGGIRNDHLKARANPRSEVTHHADRKSQVTDALGKVGNTPIERTKTFTEVRFGGAPVAFPPGRIRASGRPPERNQSYSRIANREADRKGRRAQSVHTPSRGRRRQFQ